MNGTFINFWYAINNFDKKKLTDRIVLLEKNGGQDSLEILTDLRKHLTVDGVTPEEGVHLCDTPVHRYSCFTAHHLKLLVRGFSVFIENT